jgi:hypothetical protein
MVERRVARASGSVPPPQSVSPAAAPRRRTTERVAPLPPNRGELPGWIWAGLGCLTVLAAGFAVMFVLINPSDAPLPAATVTTMPPTPPSGEADPGSPSNIQVVPLGGPAAASTPSPAHRPKPARPAPPRAVRVARSPSLVHKAEKAAAPSPSPSEQETEASSDGNEEELLKPVKPRTAAKTRPAATQGDQEESETSAAD